MRYLGNKTKLLTAIEGFAHRHGVEGRSFLDCFAGTGVVGAHFKRLGYRVSGCDLLASSYVAQVCLFEVSEAPSFRALLSLPALRRGAVAARFERELDRQGPETPVSLARAIAALVALSEPEEGLIYRNYAPSGGHGRRYFRDEHAKQLDAFLSRLRDWRCAGVLEQRGEFYLLLMSILKAADRVANIAGVYAAYLKRWQSNTEGPLKLVAPTIVPGLIGQAHRGDSNQLVAEFPCDVLYIDPPYNTRQYAAYYHVREIMAELHEVDDLERYERRLYGKNGLRPYDDLKSAYCSRRRREGQSRCELAFLELIERARARHVIVSYNEEGILDREVIGGALARYSGDDAYDLARNHEAVAYRRFRSDANGRNGRRYKTLEGKARDRVDEWLFYARARRGALRGL